MLNGKYSMGAEFCETADNMQQIMYLVDVCKFEL